MTPTRIIGACLCEVTRIGTGPHFIGQIRVLYLWEQRAQYESGLSMHRSNCTTSDHEAPTLDGVQAGNRLSGAVIKDRAHEAQRFHDQEVR